MTDRSKEWALERARATLENLGEGQVEAIRQLLRIEIAGGAGPKDACDHVADFIVAIYQMIENLTIEEIMAIRANVAAVTFVLQEDLKRRYGATYS
jgi:hypothetical protein